MVMVGRLVGVCRRLTALHAHELGMLWDAGDSTSVPLEGRVSYARTVVAGSPHCFGPHGFVQPRCAASNVLLIVNGGGGGGCGGRVGGRSLACPPLQVLAVGWWACRQAGRHTHRGQRPGAGRGTHTGRRAMRGSMLLAVETCTVHHALHHTRRGRLGDMCCCCCWACGSAVRAPASSSSRRLSPCALEATLCRGL